MHVVYLGDKNNSIIFKLMFLMHLLGGEGAGGRGQCLNVVYLGVKDKSIIFKLMFLMHLTIQKLSASFNYIFLSCSKNP